MFRGRQPADIDGESRSGRRRRRSASPTSPTSRRSSSSWRRTTPAPRSTTSTSRRWSGSCRAVGRRDLEALRELERELERQGYLQPRRRRAALTPKALRRLGETALRRIFAAARRRRGRGDHDDPRSGGRRRAHRRVPAVAVRRRASDRRRPDGAERRAPPRRPAARRREPARLDVEDFEVAETERRTRPRSRSASTCRSRWSRRIAGGR